MKQERQLGADERIEEEGAEVPKEVALQKKGGDEIEADIFECQDREGLLGEAASISCH